MRTGAWSVRTTLSVVRGAGPTARRLPAWWPVTAVVFALATGFGVFVGLTRRDAAAVRPLVVAAIVAGLLATLWSGRGRQCRPSGRWLADVGAAVVGFLRRPRRDGLAVAVWVLLIVAFAAWDAFSFSRGRTDFPTLSRYLGVVTAFAWGRGLLAAAWVGAGAGIALARRRPLR